MKRRNMRVLSVKNLSSCYNTWISFFPRSMQFAISALIWLESAKC